MNESHLYDLVVYWLTHHRDRNLISIRKSCEALNERFAPAKPLHRDWVVDRLLRLGHVERNENKVYIVPPTLLWLDEEVADAKGLFFGAREASMIDGFSEQGVEVHETPIPHQPAIWSVAGDRPRITEIAEKLGFRVGLDRFDHVLAALPTVGEAAAELPEDPDTVSGLPWESLDLQTRRWSITEKEPFEPGLYRSKKGRIFRYRYVDGEHKPHVVRSPNDRHVAAWAMAACGALGAGRPRSLMYDDSRSKLSVPALGARLPVLLDRALMVRSGHWPKFEDGRHVYINIAYARAQHIARVLSLSLDRLQGAETTHG